MPSAQGALWLLLEQGSAGEACAGGSQAIVRQSLVPAWPCGAALSSSSSPCRKTLLFASSEHKFFQGRTGMGPSM